MRLSQAICLVIVAGCNGKSSLDGESRGLTAGRDLAVVSVTVAPRVKPGGTPGATLAVSIQVKNTGSTNWGNNVLLKYVGEGVWTGSNLMVPATKSGKTATVTGTLGAPTQIGRYDLAWQAFDGSTSFGPVITAKTEVTCSDGVFCNGDERYVNGKCQAVGAAPVPCGDGVGCNKRACHEDTQRCDLNVDGDDCNMCAEKNCNPSCHLKACGDDGCGGSCGSCGTGQVCQAGECIDAIAAGTCANPLALDPNSGLYTILGDNSDGVNELIPGCDAVAAKEKVYKLVLTQTTGIDAQSFGIDTVLSIYKDVCDEPAQISCNDDSAPPGDYGSHVYKLLQPGTYYIAVNGFDNHAEGPYTLQVRLVPNCVPQCDGKFCGDDGCPQDVYDCGACEEGQVCNLLTSRCRPSTCVPLCGGRQCGGDTCGGFCGNTAYEGKCAEGKACDELTGTCKNAPACDHDKPVCPVACATAEYCGTDCECHRSRDARPDLVVDVAALAADPFIDTVDISESSCTIFEACVDAPGPRKLLHFTVGALNQGSVNLVVPPPKVRPDLFEYSSCHGHYHFHGFANYALYNQAGVKVKDGLKLAYCMEDTDQIMDGPTIPCDKKYDCTTQGIQAGWSDIYGNTLDCQWLDITTIPSGNYRLEISLNPDRAFEEATFDNNSSSIPVVIP